MGKEILTFGCIEIDKNKFYRNKPSFFRKDADMEKLLVSTKICFGKKAIDTLLVTYIIIIKLCHYMQSFLKQVLM